MNIIVTGASRGIGKELVLNFAKRGGHQIMAIARNEIKLLALKDLCLEHAPDVEIIPVVFDLENGDYDLLARKVRGIFPEIHILINNAGALVNKKFGHLTADDFDHLMNVNVKAAFLLSQSLLPFFESDAHIVNISSM
jgi:NAD(P)-dependent dehydrogenase (short-subunit alcohol dehydrogenase family)